MISCLDPLCFYSEGGKCATNNECEFAFDDNEKDMETNGGLSLGFLWYPSCVLLHVLNVLATEKSSIGDGFIKG